MRKAEAKELYVAGIVWNIWADFWATKASKVPPVNFLRIGGGEDYVFVTSASEQEVDLFIQAVIQTPDLRFKKQSNWWLPPQRWFGTWNVFSAQMRQTYYGIDRRLFANDEVLDFEGSGDPRTKALRSDEGIANLKAE